MEDAFILLLVAQFFVGIFQLLMATIRSFTAMWRFQSGYFSLPYYWTLVAGYFLGSGGVYLLYEYRLVTAEWYGITFLLSAWLIAGYYWKLVYEYLQATAPEEAPVM